MWIPAGVLVDPVMGSLGVAWAAGKGTAIALASGAPFAVIIGCSVLATCALATTRPAPARRERPRDERRRHLADAAANSFTARSIVLVGGAQASLTSSSWVASRRVPLPTGPTAMRLPLSSRSWSRSFSPR